LWRRRSNNVEGTIVFIEPPGIGPADSVVYSQRNRLCHSLVISDYITNDMMKYSNIVSIQKVGYDPYNSTQWAIDATEKGLPLE